MCGLQGFADPAIARVVPLREMLASRAREGSTTAQEISVETRMPINYSDIMRLKASGDAFSYTDRDTMLYALGIGFGRDPLNEAELPFVYENGLRSIPTLSTVVAWGSAIMGRTGINYLYVLHGEQRLTVHKPLPVAAQLLADERVTGAFDKGKDKGAFVIIEKTLR